MQVLIVDDEPLAREELQYLLTQNQQVTQIFEADSIESAMQQLMGHQIDLVFLDIQLGDENGFTLAKQLKAIAAQPRIIFATAYDQYALDAFNANALDYILKPFEQARVDEAVQKGLQNRPVAVPQQTYNPRLAVTIDDKTQVINKADIITVSVDQGVLTLRTASGDYQSRQTLSHLRQQLDPQKFMQVHRSYLVNLDQVDQTEPSFNHTYQLTMRNGDKIPVGRAFVAAMKAALGM